jgi:phage shock protein PspC (stress-responsive transcriptional regulator)
MLVTVSGNAGSEARGAGVEETLKDFWATRPRRSLRDRKIAGVAAGIAQRYHIDPVVVRIGFVVAALCNGAGLLIYLLGWLLLAREDDEVSPAEALVTKGRSSTSTGLTVLLCVLLLPTSGFFAGGGFPMISGVVLSVGALYLLHRNRGHLGRSACSAAPAHDTAPAYQATATEPMSTTPHATSQDIPPVVPTPPAWDPLGAAPFAWDLPEPGQAVQPPPEPPAPRRRTRVGAITFGLALLVAGAAVIAGRGSSWFTAPHVIGLVVGVLGLGLVAGSIVGGGRGLIGLVIPLSVVGVLLTQVSPQNWQHVGDIATQPTSLEQVQSRYDTGAGSIDLNLDSLPSSGTVHTSIDVGVGSATVQVPRNADVEAMCSSGIGHVSCLGEESNGNNPSRRVKDNGLDGPGGLKIVLDVHSGVGDVAVNRG